MCVLKKYDQGCNSICLAGVRSRDNRCRLRPKAAAMTRVTGVGVGDHVVAVEGDAAEAVEAGATSGNNFEIEDRRRRRKPFD